MKGSWMWGALSVLAAVAILAALFGFLFLVAKGQP